MVREIVRDAVQIKLKIRDESPLISVYEFCYAVGYTLKTLHAPETLAEEFRALTDFEEWKTRAAELVNDAAQKGEIDPEGRLTRLICGCRIRGELSEDACALFEMGFA